MVRCFSCPLDFCQSSNTFYGISAFFKHNFCLAPRWKIIWPRWIYFFSYFPTEIFEFSFNPRCRFGWPPGYLDRVYKSLEAVYCFFVVCLLFLEMIFHEFASNLLLAIRHNVLVGTTMLSQNFIFSLVPPHGKILWLLNNLNPLFTWDYFKIIFSPYDSKKRTTSHLGPAHSTHHGINSHLFGGSLLWNNLPREIKESFSTEEFKKRLKEHWALPCSCVVWKKFRYDIS